MPGPARAGGAGAVPCRANMVYTGDTHLSRIRIVGTTVALLLVGAAEAHGAATVSRSAAERIWYAQGLLHPAIVHVPIGLLVAAAIAACLRVLFRRISLGVVYYCLLIGALGMIPSVTAGWAWAPQKDPGYVDPMDATSNIFWHRWGGIGVAAGSLLVTAWATSRLWRKRRYEAGALAAAGTVAVPVPAAVPAYGAGDHLVAVEAVVAVRPPGQAGWQFATVLLAAATSWVAHDGGELVYPKNLEKVIAIATGAEAVKLKGASKPAAESMTITPPPPAAAPIAAAAAEIAKAATAPATTGPATGPADAAVGTAAPP
ncbi:MAG: hypothetical protein JWO31_2333, partial [Phycisphaerales bacterium]|nr:hypothetical protein [Phycisphaerales bacterium]